MITIDLPKEAEDILAAMAGETGRNVDEIVRRAILDYLEDWEDTKWAEESIAEDLGDAISFETVMREFEERDRAAKSAAE